MEAIPQARFDPVPLLVGPPAGYAPDQLDDALRAWASSPPLRALAAASGWSWPAGSSTLDLLSRLAGLSTDWDFRRNRERSSIERGPVTVNGRPVPDSLIIGAARALGMVDATPLALPVAGREFSYLVVLAGQARACVNRAHYAAHLLRSGLRTGTIVAIGAHRQLGAGEPERAAQAGLGHLTDEADVILAATCQAFGLDAPVTADVYQPAASLGPLAAFHAAAARYRWPSVEVVIAPSDTPQVRRAKTGDQLRFWADLAGLAEGHDILVLTTQIYVPYQHLVACRVLGLERGCGVYSCGVEAGVSYLPVRNCGGREYLQEIRAALRAALALLTQAHESAS